MYRGGRPRALGLALAALACLQVLGIAACVHGLVTAPSAAAARAVATPPTGEPPSSGASSDSAVQRAQVSSPGPRPSVAVPPAPEAVVPVVVPTTRAAPAVSAGSPPVAATQVTAPAVALDAALVPLGLDAAGALDVPDDPGVPGWFTGGAAPGERGPTVLAGHVDSRSGPAVFFRLRELRPGDSVAVTRSDGRVVWYVVDRVEQHDKGAFPTEAVYGSTSDSQLRLVTCGGVFDPAVGSYRANIVVFARLAVPEVPRPPTLPGKVLPAT